MTAAITAGSLPAQRQFFARSALAMAAIVLLSFPHTYYVPLVSGTRRFHLLHHVHGLAYFLWMALYVVQTQLVVHRDVARHRELGLLGFALTGAMVPLGYWMAQRGAELRTAAGAARPFEFSWFNVVDAGLFSTAMLASMLVVMRRPDWHRRFVYAAALCLVAPAATRWTLRIPYLDPIALDVVSYLLTYPFFVALCVHDLRTARRLHPATLTSLALVVPVQLASPWIARSEWWNEVAARVLAAG